MANRDVLLAIVDQINKSTAEIKAKILELEDKINKGEDLTDVIASLKVAVDANDAIVVPPIEEPPIE